MKKKVAIGYEFYKQVIDRNCYYVDKTLLIRDILDSSVLVNLFTRPRRFGKTLAIQMLKVFFEDERDRQGNKIDNNRYFEGKKIMSCGEKYTERMGQYPVISLTLKSAKQPNFEMAYQLLRDAIREEFRRHWYVHESGVLMEDDKVKFKRLMEAKGESSEYATALAFLSQCLYQYHGKNAVILIDEYDVPLENSYFRGFYDQMIDFIRSLFESSLKTNTYLEFAVITGCLRISRESIFTGLNNLKVISVLNREYVDAFGFTQEEVDQMLADYGFLDKREEVKKWYNGYLFGQTEIYNPWSVVNFFPDI